MAGCKTNYNPSSQSARGGLQSAMERASGPLENEYGELFDKIDEIQRAKEGGDDVTARKELEEATKVVNTGLQDAFFNHPEKLESDYPFIKNRLDKIAFVTPVEIDEFSKQYFYKPSDVSGFLSFPKTGPEGDSKRFFDNLNAFYQPSTNSDLTMGSFCALVPSIFAGIEQFVEFFNNIAAIAGKIGDFIGKISDLGIAGIIEKLEEQITKVIDRVVAQVKQKIENIKSFFTRKIKHYRATHDRIMAKVQTEVDRVDSFFSKENIDRIKKQAKGLISYALSLFEDPKLEEIEFIVYRFCKFVTQMETRMFGMVGPIAAMIDDYDSTYTTLQTSADVNSAMAKRAGAIRYDGEQQQAGRVSSSSYVSNAGRYNPVQIDDYNEIIPWNDGNGIPGKLVFPAKLGGMGREGYDRLQVNVKIYLARLQKAFGRELRINSAYRSPSYNRSVGGVPNSMHVEGCALDIAFDGVTNSATREEFLRYAYEAGFEWHKVYNSFVHIDIKKRTNPRSNLAYIFGQRQGLITDASAMSEEISPYGDGWSRINKTI